MSSSSEAIAIVPAQDDSRLLSRALAAVAWEISSLANEVSDLGASLSETAFIREDADVMMRFQAFDRLTQNAHAQAQLIAHIARQLLLRNNRDRSELLALVEDIPVHDVKVRMRESVGAVRSRAVPEAGAIDFWDD
ncbi:MAG: hypothetical protein JSR60_09420 [Proteobacteria bacterium]|nr:hypothetical protein [Pseudomonadota bacterium]